MGKRKNRRSKFKIYPSFIVLVVLCLVFNRFNLLVNYLLALSFHELAHSFVATSRGYSFKEFKLDMLGASVELDDYIDELDSFAINLAGPAANLIMCIFCLALYYLIPKSHAILNSFCMANLVIAVFNLLPIYPLDGGKIFSSFFKTERQKKIFNIIAKSVVFIISILVFVAGVAMHKISIIPILLIIFVLTAKSETKVSLALFKNKEFKGVQSVNILRITEDDKLINVVKKIKKNSYTIFYSNETKKFFDEDYLIDMTVKLGPNACIKELNK